MTKTNRNGNGHRAYRRKQANLKRQQLNCSWCGNPIDYTLHYLHPQAFTADHPTAVNNGGHLYNQELQPMHRSCNAKKSDTATITLRPSS